MGFVEKWRTWISVIISSAKQSVQVNGSSSKEFKIERGLRQGDPLSSILFKIVTQILHELLHKATQVNIIQGVKIGKKQRISHLQFVEDTIIFIEDNWNSIKGIKTVLTIFEILSDLKINYRKRYIIAPTSPKEMVDCWAGWLRCQVGKTPFKYLGANIGSSASKNSFWKPLTKKVTSQFSRWRCNSLSKSGRLIMINAVLDALPWYWMALYRIPKGIVKEIESLKRSFYWRETGKYMGKLEGYTQ